MQQYVEFAGNHPIVVVIWVGLLLAIIVSYVQSFFSKIKAASPATSIKAPCREMMTGNPKEKASNTGNPNPSFAEGKAYPKAFWK